MEGLLPELAARVAKHLTPRDLAACCAVSVHWRDIFGTNEVWKRLCDLKIEEHLRTIPCIVEPVFSVCHDENSTLSPLSRWRLAFLREQHLWRNWRKGNYQTVEHEVEKMKQSLERFVTNDFIVSFNLESLGLWNVRTVPPIRVDILDFGHEVHYSPTVFENGLVVLKNEYDVIQVIKIDVIACSILMKYQFHFNSQCPELVCSNTPVFNEAYSMVSFDVIVVKGKFCIGYFRFAASNNSFHLWDLESGLKLKKESLPAGPLEGGLCIVGSKTCDNVLVLVPDTVDFQPPGPSILFLECKVYNVQNLSFLPFSQTCSVFSELMSGLPRDFDKCAITNNFVALTDCEDNAVRIFNYQTGHQMYCLNNVNSGVQVLADDCFIFMRQKSLPTEENEEEVRLCSVFCSSGDVVKDITGFDVEHFEVVGDRLVEIVPFSGDSEVWLINRYASFKTEVNFPEFKEVNKACTKLITERTVEETDMIRISHFW